jgi:hypothetical protein
MIGKKAIIAIAAAAAMGVLGGVLGAASAAWAKTGSHASPAVIPRSKAGVNPAWHPEFFGSPTNYQCFERFETYDLASETYIGHDGRRHTCRAR